MVTEPNIDKTLLIKFLEQSFPYKIESLTFNPKGWASWSYTVRTEEQKFFLKIYKDINFNFQTFDFINKLSTKCGIRNISYPISSKTGEVGLKFDGFQIVLFNFIDGITSSEQKLTDNQIKSLGELLSKIHQSKEVIGPYAVHENFQNQHKDEIIKLLNSLDKINPNNKFQEEAKELYLKYKEIFLNEVKILDTLKVTLENQNLDFVNCHGEPSPDNIMIDPQGDIYLIDWDFPIFAPKEKDLEFFNDKYDQVLEGYKEYSDDLFINKNAENFYLHSWNVQEIEDFGSQLLTGDISDKEYQANLEEFKNFLNYSGLESI